MRPMTDIQEVIWGAGEELIKNPPADQEDFYLKLREVNKMFTNVIQVHDNCVALMTKHN